jgi:hypothetical protein
MTCRLPQVIWRAMQLCIDMALAGLTRVVAKPSLPLFALCRGYVRLRTDIVKSYGLSVWVTEQVSPSSGTLAWRRANASPFSFWLSNYLLGPASFSARRLAACTSAHRGQPEVRLPAHGDHFDKRPSLALTQGAAHIKQY